MNRLATIGISRLAQVSLAGKASTVALNPQPLPPKASPGGLQPGADRSIIIVGGKPTDRLAARIGLNPQPLPPKPSPVGLFPGTDRSIIIVGGKPNPTDPYQSAEKAGLNPQALPPKAVTSSLQSVLSSRAIIVVGG